MTTKRKIMGRLVPCRCFRGEEEVISVLDYSHCSLQQVPKEIFSFERTLEELYLDANQIEELPKQLFSCQALRKLSMPDNDLSNLPTTISCLVNLKELDVSKNGIQEFPDNIKGCKCLSVVEASVNPITKLPDGFTQLLNLTQLFLNDAFLECLPTNFGRLSKLRILELRENHLKSLPKSLHKLSQLERLDLGSNEFSELPDVLEQIQHLKELWMDNNSLQRLPGSLGKLKHLTYLDVSKNRIETLDSDISGCEALEDLLLSANMLQQLPDSIGMLKKLTTLKVDENQLSSLPNSIGSLSLLEEFDGSCNELETLPSTIGYLHSLRTFAADENFLTELPREIGSCRNVTVMSLRSNKLEQLPDEIGQMTKLRVLNLSDNRLKNLPFTFTKLKDLSALWLSDNQSKALIPLQSEAHPETKQRVLTNYMFPQQPRRDEVDYQSDSDSFNPALWEEQRQQRMTVAFDFEEKEEDENSAGKVKVEINLKRYPTPYPEDLKNMVKSMQGIVGKTGHALSAEKITARTMELHGMDKYEHKWQPPTVTKEVTAEATEREAKDFQKAGLVDSGPLHALAKEMLKRQEKEGLAEGSEDSRCGSPNDIRISDMRPKLVEPPVYKPKVVLLGKDKKESAEESDMDKAQCLNTSGSSAPSSEYSPSQASTGSSNPPGTGPAPPSAPQEATPAAHWTNRLGSAIPLLCQRETPPPGTLQQRGERRPLSDTFDRWNNAPHYDNTAFVGEDGPGEPPCSAAPAHGPRPQSASGPARRPLLRQDRIVGLPLELEDSPYAARPSRNTPEVPPPHSRWHNWTRTPSPLEDRTAFPSKLDLTRPERGSTEREAGDMGEIPGELPGELPGSFPSARAWGAQDGPDSGTGRGLSGTFSHLPAGGTMVLSKSTERLSPVPRDVRSKFKKSQSIDELEGGSPTVYSIPLDGGRGGNAQGSGERPDLPSLHQQNIPRSQSAPMLDDDAFGVTHSPQQQSAGPPPGIYQGGGPQGPDRRAAAPFSSPECVTQAPRPASRGQRGYLPGEAVFSLAPPLGGVETGVPGGVTGVAPRSRPGLLRRADSLVSSAELAVFRRAVEAQEQQLAERYPRPLLRTAPEHQNSPAPAATAEPHFYRRNGRYANEYLPCPEPKKPPLGYPTKSLPQRRPLSARSFSTEAYGASQARPVSARPSMAALLEKAPADHTLSPCLERSPEGDLRARPDSASSRMPPDWRQQLLRHIEAKRLDRSAVLKHNTLNLGTLCSGRFATPHASGHMTINLHSNANQRTLWPALPQGPLLEKGQEEVSPMSQWGSCALGRRDVPPESLMRKAVGHPHPSQAMMMTPASATPPHRPPQDQPYEGAISELSFQQYPAPLPLTASTASARPQSARCLIQTKGQKSREGYQEQFCVRIEKSPGLGFSISGGISGQGNPFRPSDMGIFVTRVQPDGPASHLLQPGDKILKANGHSFLNMEHTTAVALLKSLPNPVDLMVSRENTA
ncbi:leucine-rich repeat-containing protein 7-like isoform X2 [Megalops cyprinoides]|nr:leucine-rich repeat-containing protein 7-like isoform X2 [Megalops cyprinoides]XP_036409976.1 leucine-rich repeat-containing protein 7-like isoform X2 [Megalops cyprinoides]